MMIIEKEFINESMKIRKLNSSHNWIENILF
jgi:hypothetical protein